MNYEVKIFLRVVVTVETYLKQFIKIIFKGEITLKDVQNKFMGVLSDRIYESRKALGITQETLAAKLGITPQSVSRWENGQSRPDVDMLPRLAAFFGITVDALFGYKAENLKITQYEEKTKGNSLKWKFETGKATREILGLVPPIGNKNILEIGCGDGQAAIFFARNGYLVSAFDIDESNLIKGRKLAEEIGVSVNFFRADLLTYKIEKEFDIIYGSGITQIIPPKSRASIFKMIQNHTKVGGVNVFNAFVDKSFLKPVPNWNKENYFYHTAELFGYYGSDWKFEMMQELYFDCDSADTPHSHCMDVMIARKIK